MAIPLQEGPDPPGLHAPGDTESASRDCGLLQPLQFVPARCQFATHGSRVSALWARWALPSGASGWGGSRPDRCSPPQPPISQLPAAPPSPGVPAETEQQVSADI